MANTDSPIEGSCLCKAVKYRITGELLGFQYCHCSRCRKFTGAAHAANVFASTDVFEWVEGEDSVGTFRLDADPPFATAFCKNCGSSLPNLSTAHQVWVIPAGLLDCDPGIKPARSIFWESRAPWYEHVSELPQHAELPES
ncbi:MAG: hypothetical protein ACI9D0_002006 [Bacteroidia bacterium]|jgi:hypothetical protein